MPRFAFELSSPLLLGLSPICGYRLRLGLWILCPVGRLSQIPSILIFELFPWTRVFRYDLGSLLGCSNMCESFHGESRAKRNPLGHHLPASCRAACINQVGFVDVRSHDHEVMSDAIGSELKELHRRSSTYCTHQTCRKPMLPCRDKSILRRFCTRLGLSIVYLIATCRQ